MRTRVFRSTARAAVAATIVGFALLLAPAASVAAPINASQVATKDVSPNIYEAPPDQVSVTFQVLSGGSKCYALAGSIGTDFVSYRMYGGAFYGYFSVNTPNGCYVINFAPDQQVDIPDGYGVVTSVVITRGDW
ncbi:hypothetical protein [Fodinicola feengrottensis]|uniref:hypothetical protein n=1 Tax=Fodinicola feengrottensis TaxID=435914 RepID=UPI0013D5FE3E|nr:hypothetical protein [Fodinicola feengrottensis]